MGIKYIKTNIISFLISYSVLVIFFLFMSYKFFLSDFIALEKVQNENNISTFLHTIDKNIENLKNTTNDYAKWDDTYKFIKDKNELYIYENFREGTATLKGLNLNAIIYTDLDNNILFSEYYNTFLESRKENFEKEVINNFKKNKEMSKIVNFNSNFIYISKMAIKRSDNTGEARGYIISAIVVSDKSFSENHTIFKKISISEKLLSEEYKQPELKYLKNVKIKTLYEDYEIKNHIEFYDSDKKYIISLIATNDRDILNNGKKTIYTFNFIVSIILFFIFFFIYKNQFLIENQNHILNKEVARRTRQLDKAFRKLKDKNKELYTFANVDSLTKIRNRRSYFLESEHLLNEAILRKHNLSVLMIDIDHFKTINDNYGHAIGDIILIKFCEIVCKIIEKDKNSIFGRIGGEEFCITFYDKSIEEVNIISESIRKKCSETEVVINNHKIRFTVSMGLSERENFQDIDKILQKSDELLYEAKNSGRNRLIRKNR